MNLKGREKTGSSILQKSHLLRSLSKNMNSVNVSVPDFATKYRKPMSLRKKKPDKQPAKYISILQYNHSSHSKI